VKKERDVTCISVRWNATLPVNKLGVDSTYEIGGLNNRTWRFIHGKAVCLNMEEKEDLRKGLMRADRPLKTWDIQ
jgi:hypothetical protein